MQSTPLRLALLWWAFLFITVVLLNTACSPPVECGDATDTPCTQETGKEKAGEKTVSQEKSTDSKTDASTKDGEPGAGDKHEGDASCDGDICGDGQGDNDGDGGERDSCDSDECSDEDTEDPSVVFPGGTSDVKPEKPMKGDSYETKATAKMKVGPFGELDVSGVIKKTGKDKPVTWCFSGAAKLSNAPFTLNGTTLKICKDEKGVILRTLSGYIQLDGKQGAISGTVSDTKPAVIQLQSPSLSLLGLPSTRVRLTWAEGNSFVQIQSADSQLDYLQQRINVLVKGRLYPGKDSELALTLSNVKTIKTVGGIAGILAEKGSGKRIRKGKQLSTSLSFSAGNKQFGQVKAGQWSVSALRVDGALWKLDMEVAKGELSVMNALTLRGTFQEKNKTACVSGSSSLKITSSSKPVQIRVCLGQPASLRLSADAVFAPVGQVAVLGTLNSKSGQLCFQGNYANGVPSGSSTAPVIVKTCWNNGLKAFSAPLYESQAALSGHGNVLLSGVFDAKANNGKGELCLAGAIKGTSSTWLPLKNASLLAMSAQSCFEKTAFSALSIGVTFKPAGSNSPVLQTRFSTTSKSGVCVTAATTSRECFGANVVWRNTLYDKRTGIVDRFVWDGVACIDRQSTSAAACQKSVVNKKTSQWNSRQARQGTLSLAPFCQKKGSTNCAWSANCSGSAGDKACTQVWKGLAGVNNNAPYVARSAGVTKINGQIWVQNNRASLDFRGVISTTVPKDGMPLLVESAKTLFSLSKPGIRSTVGVSGVSTNTIVGEIDRSLTGNGIDPLKIIAYLEGRFEARQLTFRGDLLPKSCNASTQTCVWASSDPFASVIGKGNFVVGGKGGSVEVIVPYQNSRDIDFSIYALSQGKLKLPGSRPTTAELQIQSLWARSDSGKLPGTAIITFAMPIAKQKMNAGAFDITLGQVKNQQGKFETRPTVLIASTESLEKFRIDLDNLESNGRETVWKIQKGVMIRSSAEIPHIKGIFPNINARIDITWKLQKFELEAALEFNWKLIKPEHNIPTIDSAEFEQVFVRLSFPGTSRLYVGGIVNFWMLDRDGKKSKLKGLAQLEADSKGSLGGTIALAGLWRNPFWIPNLAVLNMGISLKTNSAFPTFPSALGFSGQALIMKDKLGAKWPAIAQDSYKNPVGVNPDGSLMSKLPDKIYTSGLTFYYDMIPAKSGYCKIPVISCVKLPPILFRFDLQNVGTDDITFLSNMLLSGLNKLSTIKQVTVPDIKGKKLVSLPNPWASLTKHLPLTKSLKPISIKPFSMKLDQLTVYMSTHSQERFGVEWPYGFRARAKARFIPAAGPDKGKVKEVELKGSMDVWGLTIKGRMSAIQLVNGLTLTGNPYRRYAQLNGGYLQFPSSTRHPWSTFEGFFQDNQVGTGSSAGVLLSYMRNNNGVLVTASEPGPACVPGAVDLNGNKKDCKTPWAKVVVTMKTTDTRVPSSHRTRIIKTKFGVMKPGTLHHVAVTFDRTHKLVKIYVDGKEVQILDTANGADGEEGTKDDRTRFLLPIHSGPMYVGQRLDIVDDIRLWTTVRTQEQVERHAIDLPKGFHNLKELVARWEIDFDRKEDKNSGGVIVRDSTFVVALHGNYKNRAAPVIDPKNQDLHFTLAYPMANIFYSGWGIKAGIVLKLPGSFGKLSGNPNGITMAADLKYLPSGIGGRLYARELTMVPIPTIGGFVVTGNGPNGKTGDYDDGLYMEGEFRYPSSFNLNPGDDQLPFVDASGGLALDWKSKRHPIVTMTLRLGCLVKNSSGEGIFSGKTCTLQKGYHVWSKALLGKKGSLEVDLGSGLGKLGITGIFLLSTLDFPVLMKVDGSLKVFGRDILNAKLLINDKGIKASSSFNVGLQHGVQFGVATKVDIQFDWKPARLCAAGQTSVRVPALATINGTVNVCLGTNPSAAFYGKARAGSFGGYSVANLEVLLDSRTGLKIQRADFNFSPIFKGRLTGYFKNGNNFDITGTAKVSMGSGKILKLTSTTRLYKSGSTFLTTTDSVLDTSGTGSWAVGSVKGAFKRVSGTNYYGLVGKARLKPAGFTISSADFWVCRSNSSTNSGFPSLCSNKTGVGARGVLDLKVAKMTVTMLADIARERVTASGAVTTRWKLGGFVRTWYEEVIKEVASKLSGWSCSSFCKNRTGGVCVLYWFRCKRNEKRTRTYNVEAKVEFTMSGTQTPTSGNITLKARATLDVGYWKGSSSSSCTAGTAPKCCFNFTSPIGKQCLKLY